MANINLLVLIPDCLSDLVKKGEVTTRYYNPGNLFDEVHILMTNDDRVSPGEVQRTVGDARLYLHNLPEQKRFSIQHTPFFRPLLLRRQATPIRGLGLTLLQQYQLSLLNRWALPALKLASDIRPNLMRCYANDYNAYVASRIKRALHIPYVVSLHNNPGAEPRRRIIDPNASRREQLFGILFDQVERIGIREADLVIPVYQSIIPYLQRVGCQNYEVAYNVLNSKLGKKEAYGLHNPVRLISVGRHFEYKNPENIIRAVQKLPQAHLTLIGDGPYKERLERLVNECGIAHRVTLHRAIPNDVLCEQLPDYDIFVVHNELWGMSKAVLEALLTGLPVITNRKSRIGAQAPEMQDDFMMLVENTKEGYLQALRTLIEDDCLRERLGRKAYAHARERWSPEKTEAKYVELYKRVMALAKSNQVEVLENAPAEV